MKKIYIICYTLLFLTSVAVSLLAADESGWGVAPIAAPYYTPDTKWAIGAYIVPYYRPSADSLFTKTDEYTFYLAYTQLNQIAFGFLPEAYFRNGKVKLSGKIEACRYPTLFWGLGPHTSDKAEEGYTQVGWWGDMSLLFRAGDAIYIGPLIHYRNNTTEDYEQGGIIDSGTISGIGHYLEAGAGFSLQIDTRDSIFFPRSGFYINHRSSFQHSLLGSDNNFGRHEFDSRFFSGIKGDHVAAFQFKAKIAHGDVPLESLSGIGGDELMRGYLENRYLDMTSLAVQAEYRFPIIWRFAGAVFAGAGQVQPSLKDYNLHDMHFAAGAGLRVIIDRSEHIAGRIDAGFDENGNPGIYVLVKEAF